MGSFSSIFGKLPKVLVLEAFAEDPEEQYSAPEIMRITGISRRAAYLIIQHFLKEGLLNFSERKRGTKYYRLNPSDLRAVILTRLEPILTMGGIEKDLKIEEQIPLTEKYPNSYIFDLIQPPKLKLETELTSHLKLRLEREILVTQDRALDFQNVVQLTGQTLNFPTPFAVGAGT